MIGDWIAEWTVLLAACGVVFLPGLAIAAGLRLRGLALWALAPVASTVTISVLAVVYGLVGVPWSPLWVGIGCLILAAAAWLGGWALGPRRRAERTSTSARWLLGAGLASGMALGALRLGFYIGDPGAVSQTNDAVFHLNALRWIFESGSASSLDVSGVLGSRSFYPAAWHGLTSLTALMAGGDIPVAANMTSLVIAVGVWPVGIAWFTRQITRGSVPAAALAAALSSALLAFPLLMLQWGVLYPYALAVAILPATAAATISLPRWAEGAGPLERRTANLVLGGIVTVAGLGAIAFAQPAVLLGWAVLALSWFSWWFAQRLPSTQGRTRAMLITAFVAAFVAFATLWFLLTRSTTGSHWPPFRGKLEVFLDVIFNAPVLLPPAIGVSILMISGIVVAIRTPSLRWLATSWAVLAALYVLCAAVGLPWMRRWLLGAFYADPYRFAALLAVVVIPLAAIGLLAIAMWAARAISRQNTADAGTAASWAVAAVAVVGAVALAVAPIVQMPKIIEHERDEESRYASESDSFLSPDERALLEELDELVPADARIIGNPGTGTAFGYMLSGRDVYPRTWSPPRTVPAWQLLGESLRDAAVDPAVCEALAVFGSPGYALDFGPGEDTPGRYVLPGMTGFEGQDGFELVAERGDASLWRITACTP